VFTFCFTLFDTRANGRSTHILPRYYRDGRCIHTVYLTKLLQKMRPGVWLWPRNKAIEFWVGWWDIPSAEVIQIPKLPHQDNVVSFLRLSRRSAQWICTCRKKSKCRILQRSNGSPPEAHSTGVSSCILLSRCFRVTRQCARLQSSKCLPVFDPKKVTNLYHPPVFSRFISARLFSVHQVANEVKITLQMLLRSKKP
jgi:hypothetical protein